MTERDKKREKALAHLKALPDGLPKTPAERGHEECPCPKNCTLHGACLLCTAYHGRKKALPFCER